MQSGATERALEAFTTAMWAKRELLGSGVLTPRQAAHVKSSLTQDIRKLCDVLVPTALVPRVSRRAHEEASTLGVDLSQVGWHEQVRFDKGRKVFHLDHVVTVLDLRTRFLEAPDAATARAAIADGLSVAWILKEENAVLDARGLRSHRPDGAAAYAECEIDLLAL